MNIIKDPNIIKTEEVGSIFYVYCKPIKKDAGYNLYELCEIDGYWVLKARRTSSYGNDDFTEENGKGFTSPIIMNKYKPNEVWVYKLVNANYQ